MDSPSGEFGFPYALLTAIAIGFVIEWFAYTNYYPAKRIDLFLPALQSPSLVDTIVEAKLIAATQTGDRVDVLILGDSSALMGVDPKVIQEQTQLTAYNLATVAWLGVEGNQVLLEEFIKNHGQPSFIIYHFAPGFIGYDVESMERLDYVRRVKQWIKIDEENKNLGPEARRVPELSIANRSFLPSQSYRKKFQSWLQLRTARTRFLDRSTGSRGSHNDLLKQIDRQDGFLGEVAVPNWKSAPELQAPMTDEPKQHFQQLINETQRMGIPMVLVANPCPEIARNEANQRTLDELESELSNLTADHPHVHFLSPATRYYPNEYMATLNHLAPIATRRNTEEIMGAFPEIRKTSD